MDVRMPGRDGIATTQAITADEDLAGVRVIVLTTFELDEYVVDAMRPARAASSTRASIPTCCSTRSGWSPVATRCSPRRRPVPCWASMTDAAAPPLSTRTPCSELTGREREVVGLVGRGLSNDEIADALYLSPLTVKTHVSRAMTKLHARDRAQLVVLAFRSGLTRLDDLG